MSNGPVFYDGGLTLRDWFAGQALVGLAVQWTGFSPDTKEREKARQCYALADAMLHVSAEDPSAVAAFAAMQAAGGSHAAAARAFIAELRGAIEKTIETSPAGESAEDYVERLIAVLEAEADKL